MEKASEVEHIKQFSGFGLYDITFIKILAEIKDPYPYMRGLIGELGGKKTFIEYSHPKRRAGKTKNNFNTLYDMGMLGVTSYTKKFLRLACQLGVIFSVLSVAAIIFTIIFNIFKVGNINYITYMLEGLYLFLSVILFFIGFSGEYILLINQRSMQRPLVIEEKRINFDLKKGNENAKL